MTQRIVPPPQARDADPDDLLAAVSETLAQMELIRALEERLPELLETL